MSESSTPHFAALGNQARLFTSIYPHLETCVHLAASLTHTPVVWLSLQGLQWEPIVIGIGCPLPKLQQVDDGILAAEKALHSDKAGPLLIQNGETMLLRRLPDQAERADFRFGAAWPLISNSGFDLGRLYIGDYVSRQLNAEQAQLLNKLAQHIAWMIETQILGGAIAQADGSERDLLWQTNQQLRLRIDALQEDHFYLTQLNTFMDTLQDYSTLKEAIAQLPALLQATFLDQPGRLYLSIPCSENSLNVDSEPGYNQVLVWGSGATTRHHMLPIHCPAVQSAHPYYSATPCVAPDDVCAVCRMPTQEEAQDNFCVPLLSSFNSKDSPCLLGGVLSLTVPPGRMSHHQRQMTIQVAHHLGKVLTRLKQAEDIHLQSIRDPLTGLFNRRYLSEVLPKIFNRAQHGHYPIGIIVFDIDHFKQFNDHYGHLAGDKVLRDFGMFLKGFVRGTDIACRYGGEEFMLVLPEANLERVIQRATRLCQGMHYMKMEYQGTPLGTVTISAGVASFPTHGSTADAVIAAADAALYQAKAAGRDRISVAPSVEL